MSDIEEEYDINEHSTKRSKIMKLFISGKKISRNIPSAPIDNASFHYEEIVAK